LKQVSRNVLKVNFYFINSPPQNTTKRNVVVATRKIPVGKKKNNF
jgi:hypothetical protein